MPPFFPGQFDAFADQVVPILQERGLFRTDYTGTTLRDHLGLESPRHSPSQTLLGHLARAREHEFRAGLAGADVQRAAELLGEGRDDAHAEALRLGEIEARR